MNALIFAQVPHSQLTAIVSLSSLAQEANSALSKQQHIILGYDKRSRESHRDQVGQNQKLVLGLF